MDKKAANASLTHVKADNARGSFYGMQWASREDFQAFKRWLAKLNVRRAHLRSPTIPINPHKPITNAERICRTIYPWNIEQYPGRHVMLAWITGLNPKGIAKYLHTGAELGAPSLERAAGWCRAKAAELLALAADLEMSAKKRRENYKPGALPSRW